jgi:hypothetical protein
VTSAQPARILRLNPTIYPEPAVAAARMAFDDQCVLSPIENGDFMAHALPGSSPMVIDEFLNCALRLAVEVRLGMPSAIGTLGSHGTAP